MEALPDNADKATTAQCEHDFTTWRRSRMTKDEVREHLIAIHGAPQPPVQRDLAD